MAKAAAKTGAGPTALVAVEQFFPEKERVIKDDWAYPILPFGARAFVWLTRFKPVRAWTVRMTEKNTPGVWGGIMCRKRYIDEKLIDVAGQIDTVVNLGAGFDTRAYRLSDLKNIPVWEVDQPGNIKARQDRIRQLSDTMPSHVRLVSIDFDRERLGTVLASHGYAANKPTFFILEGVTQYLTETGIGKTFDFLSTAERGSLLALTYVRKDFLDGQAITGWEKGYEKFVVKEKLWLFGMNPDAWPDFLAKYGWQAVEDIGYGELAERYIKPTGRQLASMSIERMLYAEKL